MIQGAAATITEYALVLVKKEIEIKKLPVKFFLAIHDEIQCIVREDYAEEWAVRMKELMIKAGQLVITSNLLGAEGGVSDVWEK